MNEWMNEYSNLYPTHETQGSMPRGANGPVRVKAILPLLIVCTRVCKVGVY